LGNMAVGAALGFIMAADGVRHVRAEGGQTDRSLL
jgi:hypothetical protein